ncbi:MAG TPA: tetraacyldisaccharide 4'-kinase [Bacteroidia bacterium]
MDALIKYLLLPVSFLYGIVIFFRNWLFDSGILPSKGFTTGIIAIGNLSAGGTGKSPMTEYLIRMLKDKFLLATLSRGYKRHTTGFILADKNSNSFQIGDEPLQFKRKFPDTIISVDENRRHGIETLLAQFPDLKAILLDDAFQHRKVKPGLNILLSDYSKMYYDDFLLPAGKLREWSSGKKRADVIIVTKCPDKLTPVEKRIVTKKINPDPHQKVFFSHIRYGDPVPVFGKKNISLDKTCSVVLLTGISNPLPLEDHLRKKVGSVTPLHYPDHHEYSIVEMNYLAKTFHAVSSENKIVVTTEKDAMRIDKLGLVEILDKLAVCYIPIEITFDENEKEEFNKLIIEYVTRTNQKNPKLH